ncbi:MULTISPECIES: SdpI family protein [Anaerococcus]|uniref:SdpI family protein n=1 Tax=Anaerococcus TaxID=165779 RepID=UPI002355579D|nr:MULTISPECIES: SdpI family protein [Anaerococcus]MDU2599436.1 SdpI family protein [Anaerococcus sp.]MDU5534491.1 SdpI family protein [Anaerococcus sp.]
MFFTILMYILPVTMVVIGLMELVLAKKSIRFMGFRTDLSMASPENWEFANSYSGKLSIIFGAILLLITIIADLKLDFEALSDITVLLVVLIELMILALVTFLTNRKLQKFVAENDHRDKFIKNNYK